MERQWKVKALSKSIIEKLSVLVHLPNQSSPKGPTPSSAWFGAQFVQKNIWVLFGRRSVAHKFCKYCLHFFGQHCCIVQVWGAGRRISWKSSEELERWAEGWAEKPKWAQNRGVLEAIGATTSGQNSLKFGVNFSMVFRSFFSNHAQFGHLPSACFEMGAKAKSLRNVTMMTLTLIDKDLFCKTGNGHWNGIALHN